ncbi:hypothetical protein G6F56_003059 [Rhizopus delemar]|nr:hypothetical protein G6F56_003059 [Rhizopus delemar]
MDPTPNNELDQLQLLQALAQRLESMEARLAASSPIQPMETELQRDPNIVERPPAIDLIPSDELRHVFPGMERDFFRSPLDDMARKRYIHVCPRTVIRQYIPPSVNLADNIGRFTKQHDAHLSEIQRRLVQVTRPMDVFMHESLRSNAAVPLEEVQEFVNTIHTLLSDVASHVTQLRMDNICRDTGLVAPAIKPVTQFAPSPTTLFEDPKLVLEHTTLARAVRSAATKRSSKRSSDRRRSTQRSGQSPSNSVALQLNEGSNTRDTHVSQQPRRRSNSNTSQPRTNSNSGTSNFQPRPSTHSRN